jgi:uncharacterized protein (UPF0261 family)
MAVYLFATLDTKGVEASFLRDALEELGVQVKLVDTSCIGEPKVRADVAREDVFRAAGTSLEDLQKQSDRGSAVDAAARGAAEIAARAFGRGELDGVLGIGGGAGTTIGTSAMRALPIGVPKLMVSTLASGDVRNFVGTKDVMMLNSVVDVAGINRISRVVLTRAAQAMAGMARGTLPRASDDKPLVAASMFGVTTPCVERAREVLERAGYEVLVFHAVGTGGKTIEMLARDGALAGVLDVTTTELADELVGGVLSAGPDRLTAAASAGVPQVVSVGALDMVNFWAIDSVPEKFKGRKLHKHNANVTLMRTTVEENRRLGEQIGARLRDPKAPAVVMLPLRGVSAIDREGQSFDDPAARAALFAGVKRSIGDTTPVIEMDRHINDAEFAEAAAEKLIELMRSRAKRT